jgi:mitochondrial intermediate peptidase
MVARTAANALPKPSRLFARSNNVLRRGRGGVFRSASASSVLPVSADDITLVSLFDQPKLGPSPSPLSPTGLFGHRSITNPHALLSLADSTIIRAQLVTGRILRAQQSRKELSQVVKNLDRLSDILCGVIDLAELIRNAHPDEMWVEAANNAYEKLCESMNVLNTHVGLYQVGRQ